MSSLLRRIQRSAERKFQFGGRGDRLGVFNPQGRDYLARIARENRRGKAQV